MPLGAGMERVGELLGRRLERERLGELRPEEDRALESELFERRSSSAALGARSRRNSRCRGQVAVSRSWSRTGCPRILSLSPRHRTHSPRSRKASTMTDVPPAHPRRPHGARPLGQRPLVRGALRRRAGDRRGHRPRHAPHRVPARQRHAARAAPARHRGAARAVQRVPGRPRPRRLRRAPTASELEKWALRLDELGIAHGGIKDAAYGSGVSFRDPDGIALEFFAPPS